MLPAFDRTLDSPSLAGTEIHAPAIPSRLDGNAGTIEGSLSMADPKNQDRRGEDGGETLMQKVVSLCKRRGFVFQSSDIYGGLKSAYDYGPLGVELKRNLAGEWWRNMVHERENVVGLDGSIIMHPDVWRASGHLASFTDPLVDCKLCKERFRADKAPKAVEGDPVEITATDKGVAKQWLETLAQQFCENAERRGKILTGAVAGACGYICPNCGSPFLSDERAFNMMFRTFLGAVDPMSEVVDTVLANADQPKEKILVAIEKSLRSASVYLRPETAQAIFAQFLNVQGSQSMKIPLRDRPGRKILPQRDHGGAFHLPSCEFEQMEMEFFCDAAEDMQWLDYWKDRADALVAVPGQRSEQVQVSSP